MMKCSGRTLGTRADGQGIVEYAGALATAAVLISAIIYINAGLVTQMLTTIVTTIAALIPSLLPF